MEARSMLNFVPSEFIIPEKMETEGYRLRMLSIDDVEKDFEAVISSAKHVSKVWPDSDWPDGLTLKQNLIDLGWHEKEFQNRTSFAYTMVTLDESKVLGCVYFYPTTKADHDAEVFIWVRESELGSGLDDKLIHAVKNWLERDWPFTNPAYPGRTITWDEWESLPEIDFNKS